LRNATHANRMATTLAQGLVALPGVKLRYPVEVNEIFIQLPETAIANLLAQGFQFYRCEGESSTTVRLVTAFNTKEDDVTAFIEAAQRYCYEESSVCESKV